MRLLTSLFIYLLAFLTVCKGRAIGNLGSTESTEVSSSPPSYQSSHPINFKDYIEHRPSRTKRHAIHGSFWGTTHLTYRIIRFGSKMKVRETMDVIARAFQVWEEQTPLRFTYKQAGRVHIKIVFARRHHGDDDDFDGKGRILAHAYFPKYGGEIHFDDDENWIFKMNGDNDADGIDLYAVAVHEIGHALGLKHSREVNAIMAPFYQPYNGSRLRLHPDDIAAIEDIYGSLDINEFGKIKYRKKKVDICRNARLDAISRMPDGKIYAFQGNYFWILKNEGGVEEGPLLIGKYFPFPGYIDDLFSDQNDNIYVFKQDEYYLLDKRLKLKPGYPVKLSRGLRDVVGPLDAAFRWHGDDRVYMFKDNKFWLYSRNGVPDGYPKSLRLMTRRVHDVEKIDAALRYSDTTSFIFVGQRYYKVGSMRLFLLPSKGGSIAKDWFKCKV